MKRFFKYTALFLVCLAWCSNAQAITDKNDPIQVVFRFVKGNDMFYVPLKENAENLDNQ